MDEKKKTILTVLGCLALLFFVTTNFLRPLLADNTRLAKEYHKLKSEIKALSSLNPENLKSMEKQLKMANAQLDKHFPQKEEFKFVQQLTSSTESLNIIFSDISYREPKAWEGYEELPVNVAMRSSFSDFLSYLWNIEQNSLLIGISSLSLRRTKEEPEILDIKATFSGFHLLLKPTPITTYLEQKFIPLNKGRLAKLLEPVPVLDNRNILSQLKHLNPFTSDYDLNPVSDNLDINIESTAASLSAVADKFSLQGILNVQGKQRAALINDTVVKEGDAIEGARVIAIKDYKVILRYTGRNYILTIGVDDAFTK